MSSSHFLICCSRFRLQLMAICCNRREGVECACWMMCDTPHWLKCLHERVVSSTWSSMSCVWFVLSLSLSVLHLVPFRVLLLSLALLFPLLPGPWPEPLPPCGRRQGNYPLALRQMRSLALWPNSHLSQVTSPSSLTTSTTPRLPKSSPRSSPATRCPRACLTRNSTMRWDHRQSALFTTVHPGARRTSGPKTTLSLFWRKFVAISLFVCLSCKNGETRAWTQFARLLRSSWGTSTTRSTTSSWIRNYVKLIRKVSMRLPLVLHGVTFVLLGFTWWSRVRPLRCWHPQRCRADGERPPGPDGRVSLEALMCLRLPGHWCAQALQHLRPSGGCWSRIKIKERILIKRSSCLCCSFWALKPATIEVKARPVRS